MPNRKLFIGCSREAKDKCDVIDWIENEIKTQLPNIDTFVWNSHGTPWANGLSTLVNLVEFTKEFHYAIFVFFPDDITNIRGTDYYITRDNVSFEMGLFYSQFGNERTYIFKPVGLTNAITTTKFRVLTDIDGIVFSEYKLDFNLTANNWAVDKTDSYTLGQLDKVIKAITKKETEISAPPTNIQQKIENTSKKIETHTTQSGMTDEYYIGHFIEHFHDLARYKSIEVGKTIAQLIADILIAIRKIDDVMDIKQLCVEQSKVLNSKIREVWVFADDPLELRASVSKPALKAQFDELKNTVVANLQAGVKYVYFVSKDFKLNKLDNLVPLTSALRQNIEIVKCDSKHFLTFFTLHFETSNVDPTEIFVSLIDKDREDLLVKMPDTQRDKIFKNLEKIRGFSDSTQLPKISDRAHHE